MILFQNIEHIFKCTFSLTDDADETEEQRNHTSVRKSNNNNNNNNFTVGASSALQSQNTNSAILSLEPT